MKSNAETSKSNKKSKGYGMKIAMAAGVHCWYAGLWP